MPYSNTPPDADIPRIVDADSPNMAMPPIPEEEQLFESSPAVNDTQTRSEFDSNGMQLATNYILETVFLDRIQEGGLTTPQPEFPLERQSISGWGGDTPDIEPPLYPIQQRPHVTANGDEDSAFYSQGPSQIPAGYEGKELSKPAPPRPQVQFTPEEERIHALVGHRLGEIATEVDRRYGRVFDDLVQQLLSVPFNWQSFRLIANHVISSGEISWARIVVLIAFALKLAYRLFVMNTTGVVRDMTQYLTTFLLEAGVLRWIWNRYGGWSAALSLVPRGMLSARGVGAFCLGACFVLFAVYFASSDRS